MKKKKMSEVSTTSTMVPTVAQLPSSWPKQQSIIVPTKTLDDELVEVEEESLKRKGKEVTSSRNSEKTKKFWEAWQRGHRGQVGLKDIQRRKREFLSKTSKEENEAKKAK